MAYPSEEHGTSNWDTAWFTVESQGDCLIVSAAGQIDTHSAVGLDRAAQVALGHYGALIFDLSHTTSVDTSGMGALVSVGNRAREQGGSVALVAPPDIVRRLLATKRRRDGFPVFDTLEEAVSATRRC